MMLQKFPDHFYSEDQLRAMVTSWSQSSSPPSFRRMIPFFFEQLSQLDSPADVWFVRDILYNSGKEVVKMDETLSHPASVLSHSFVKDVYSEQLRGKRTALELIKSLNGITAEITCAMLIKDAGADNITKCTTPEDISCTYNGSRVGIQVKDKQDEDFNQWIIEQTITGEMFRQSSQALRDYSHFSVLKCTKVRGGFLPDSILYIHSLLCNHLQQRGGSHETNRLKTNLTENTGKLYLDIVGKGKYKGSVLEISFQQDPSKMLGSVKVARRGQEPEKEFWDLLDKRISDVTGDPRVIGWIDFGMSFQYGGYLSIALNQKEIRAFLEKYPRPLLLRVKVKFDENMHSLFANKEAMAFPLIEKLLSKEPQAEII